MSKKSKRERAPETEWEPNMVPLDCPFELIEWAKSPVYVPNMVRILTHMDTGSSLVHAVLNAFYIPYREGKLFGQDISQVELVHLFRRELALMLLKTMPNKSITYVEELGNGSWVNMESTDINTLSTQLMSNTDFDPVMIEHLSNVTNTDIYIIDAEHQDLDRSPFDLETRYKMRSSIVILKLHSHYELVGLRLNSGEFITLFSHKHHWINSMYNRLAERMCS